MWVERDCTLVYTQLATSVHTASSKQAQMQRPLEHWLRRLNPRLRATRRSPPLALGSSARRLSCPPRSRSCSTTCAPLAACQRRRAAQHVAVSMHHVQLAVCIHSTAAVMRFAKLDTSHKTAAAHRAVQVWAWHKRQEELRAVGVWPRVRHRQHARHIVLQSELLVLQA